MNTVAGIFHARADAERAVENLHSIGIADAQISLLTPGTSEGQLDSEVPTTETEQPGMGKAMGGAVGGALGAAGGATVGAALASLFVPGVGPVLAVGIIGAALLGGGGGAAAGAAAGNALEDSIATGLPHDELYVYEDALRKGHTVVIATAETDGQGEAARNVLAQAGAESLDAARENWWIGLRDAEKEKYTEQGRDFGSDEAIYRRGFEASLHSAIRNRSYEEAADSLRERYGDVSREDAFRHGYERGVSYQQELREKHKR